MQVTELYITSMYKIMQSNPSWNIKVDYIILKQLNAHHSAATPHLQFQIESM